MLYNVQPTYSTMMWEYITYPINSTFNYYMLNLVCWHVLYEVTYDINLC